MLAAWRMVIELPSAPYAAFFADVLPNKMVLARRMEP